MIARSLLRAINLLTKLSPDTQRVTFLRNSSSVNCPSHVPTTCGLRRNGRPPTATTMAACATAGNTAPSLSCQHVLHVFPSFGIGGVPLRMVRIINHFGKRFRHTVIALDNNFAAAEGIAGSIEVKLLPRQCPKRGVLRAIAGSLLELRRLQPDLLLTYNWGAIEWAMASRLLWHLRHVHLEAGFGQREADSQIPRRVLTRRWALARCALVVVPSRSLEEVARRIWRLLPERVAYVPNGVDTARFSKPARDRLPGFTRKSNELVIGTVAPLRPEKNVGRLLR